jgi:hypothetical protein
MLALFSGDAALCPLAEITLDQGSGLSPPGRRFEGRKRDRSFSCWLHGRDRKGGDAIPLLQICTLNERVWGGLRPSTSYCQSVSG